MAIATDGEASNGDVLDTQSENEDAGGGGRFGWWKWAAWL